MAYAKKLKNGWTARREVKRGDEDVVYAHISGVGHPPAEVTESAWEGAPTRTCRIATWEKWIEEASPVRVDDDTEVSSVTPADLNAGDDVRWKAGAFFYRGVVVEANAEVARVAVHATGYDGRTWYANTRKPVVKVTRESIEGA